MRTYVTKFLPLLLLIALPASAQKYYEKTSINPSVLYSQGNWQGSGSNALLIPSTVTGIGMNFARNLTGALNVADFYFHRTANYTGGDGAHTNAALYAKTVVSAGVQNYEWNAIFVMDNSGTLADGAQNLATGAVAYKRSTGNTWARYAELDDDNQDSTGGAVTDEVDLFANGTQANANRLIMHLVGGPKTYGGNAHIQSGIKFSPQGGSAATSTLKVDDSWLWLTGDYLNGLHCEGGSSVGGSSCILDERTGTNVGYGINLSGNYFSAAIYIRNDRNFLWSSDQTARMKWVNADRCLENFSTTTLLWSVCEDGHVAATGNLTVAGTVTSAGTTAADEAASGKVGEVASIHCLVGGAAAAATTVTMTIATPAVVTWTSHTFVPSSGLANYTCPINFTTTGALPTGVVAGTTYYIIGSTVSGDTFQIADTAAHALAASNAVATSGSQSGTQAAYIGAVGATNTVVTGAALKLTAGDWDCSGSAEYQELTAITSTRFAAGIDTSIAVTSFGNLTNIQTASSALGGVSYYLATPVVRENVSVTTSVFEVDDATFTGGTMNQGGNLYCRRMR